MSKMRFVGLATCLGIAIFSAYMMLKPTRTWWSVDDGYLHYRVISDGPFFGEGYYIALEVSEKRNGKLFFYRRLISGLDTNGPPGFENIRLDSAKRTIVVTVIIDGKKRDVEIAIEGGEAYWSSYVTRS